MQINKKDLEQLFKENYKALYFYALSYTNDPQVTEDIISDIFEYLWSSRKKIDISYSLKPFIYRMLKNRCINYLRHERVKQKYIDYSLRDMTEAEEDLREHETLIRKMMTEIEKLPDKRRLVFKMCFLENKKYKEVGNELNISVNTVKTHIRKALMHLRENVASKNISLFLLIKSTSGLSASPSDQSNSTG